MTSKSRLGVGVWAWGTITGVLAAAYLGLIVVAGLEMKVSCADGKHCITRISPEWLEGLYIAFKDNGSLVAAILGFSGLAWAHFFTADNNSETTSRFPSRKQIGAAFRSRNRLKGL